MPPETPPEWISFKDHLPRHDQEIYLLMYDKVWKMVWKTGPVPNIMQGWKPFPDLKWNEDGLKNE